MNNIDPKQWGPCTWDFLYYVGLAYPDSPSVSDKQNMKDFLLHLKNVLPCEKCRINYRQHLQTIKITDETLANRYNLIVWLINLSNEISKLNGKNKITTYDEVIDKYLRNKKKNIGMNIKTITNIGIIIIVILLFTYMKLKKLYQ